MLLVESTKYPNLEILNLEIRICLVFGAWNLGFQGSEGLRMTGGAGTRNDNGVLMFRFPKFGILDYNSGNQMGK